MMNYAAYLRNMCNFVLEYSMKKQAMNILYYVTVSE